MLAKLVRADPSTVRTAGQPSPARPTRPATGARTSVKNTSLKCSEQSISWIGRTSMPSDAMSTSNRLRPCRAAGPRSVPHSSRPKCACRAILLQIFWPFTTKWSPRQSPLVVRLGGPDPAPGSENSWHQISRPIRIGSRCRARCSSVPVSISSGATKFKGGDSSTGSNPRRSSSSWASRHSTGPAARPPNSTGSASRRTRLRLRPAASPGDARALQHCPSAPPAESRCRARRRSRRGSGAGRDR
jgi:hypothetical protein